jgi:hypothetical protein
MCVKGVPYNKTGCSYLQPVVLQRHPRDPTSSFGPSTNDEPIGAVELNNHPVNP